MHFCFLTIGTFSENAMMKRVKGLAPHIAAAGHDVIIVAQNTDENREYFSTVEAEKKFFSSSGLLQEIRQKARVIWKRRPDVVYACGWGLRNLPALLGNIAVVEHAELLSSFPAHERGILLRLKDYLLEWGSLMGSDGFVLASGYLYHIYDRRDLLGIVDKLRLPYGLHLDGRSTDRSNKSKGKVSRILYMGSLYASYGIFDIVDAAAHVSKTEEPAEFVILGDGPGRAQAIERARRLDIGDHIQFEGYVDEEVLGEHLSAADVFLAPMFDTVKDKARCPSKIPMYMRYQRPIVTCRIGEVPAYLGENGFYFRPGNPESMARQILRAIRSPRPIEYDLQEVSWKNLTDRFLSWVENKVKKE